MSDQAWPALARPPPKKPKPALDDFPENLSLNDINTKRYSLVHPGRLTVHAIQRRKLRHEIRDIQNIRWGDTSKPAEPEPDPWEIVRKDLHYAVDDAEKAYTEVIGKISDETERRQEVEEWVAEESAELEEFARSNELHHAEIQTWSDKQQALVPKIDETSKELFEEEVVVEKLRKELAKVLEAKNGFRAQLDDLEANSAKFRAHWKSEKATSDREAHDSRNAIRNFESNLANLKDKLAYELARGKSVREHYDTQVAQLEQDVAEAQVEFDKASAAKTAAVSAFTEEQEKWRASHRENRAAERKLAEERKSLEEKSKDLESQLSETHRKTRVSQRSSRISDGGISSTGLPGIRESIVRTPEA